MELVSIIFLCVIVGLLYIWRIRLMDKYEQEPYWVLIMTCVTGGGVSVVVSLLVYELFDIQHDFVDAMLKIGPIEEGGKLFALVILYPLYKKHLNEITDGLVYMAMVALGFSLIENVFYSLRSNSPYTLLIMRSCIATVGHISFSGIMGLAFYIHIKIKNNYWGLLNAFIIASLGHGLYDGVIFSTGNIAYFIVVFVLCIILQLRLFKTALSYSRFRIPLQFARFETNNQMKLLTCPNCDNQSPSLVKSFRSITFVECSSCQSLVFNDVESKKMLDYFVPAIDLKQYIKDIPEDRLKVRLSKEYAVYYNNQFDTIGGTRYHLSEWLESLHFSERKRFTRQKALSFLLTLIGLDKLKNRT